MALVVRIDTWEHIGYFAGLNGPLAAEAHGCIFDAWRHPDGRLRHEPSSALPRQPVRLSVPRL